MIQSDQAGLLPGVTGLAGPHGDHTGTRFIGTHDSYGGHG
jgi:hypothetical protein